MDQTGFGNDGESRCREIRRGAFCRGRLGQGNLHEPGRGHLDGADGEAEFNRLLHHLRRGQVRGGGKRRRDPCQSRHFAPPAFRNPGDPGNRGREPVHFRRGGERGNPGALRIRLPGGQRRRHPLPGGVRRGDLPGGLREHPRVGSENHDPAILQPRAGLSGDRDGVRPRPQRGANCGIDAYIPGVGRRVQFPGGHDDAEGHHHSDRCNPGS